MMPKSANTADEYEFVDHDETALSPDVLAEIREWLQPTEYLADSGEFRRHLSSQAPGTGLWICETEEYRKWHDSAHHGSLWIKGVPGAGKSVTAASIIHHLRTTEDCPVLFFFFRNIVAANFSPRALIQDWLAQLLPFSPRLQYALQSRLKTTLAETSDHDLIQLFLDGLSSVSKVYCVADALDEMAVDNRPFLDELNGLATFGPRSLKLLITSRPKQYLQSALRDSSIVHISLQQQLVDADITSYLNYRFDTISTSHAERHIKQQVVDMVARRSEGLFLYAKLTMDQVEASMLSDNMVDVSALEASLPVGLEQMYISVLAKQREEHGVGIDLQVIVLEAVTHASRPLRLYELASLIQCVCPDVIAPRGFKALIPACCGPLVEILEDETLQVIHHSFTEFLRGDSRTKSTTGASASHFPVIIPDKAHKRMAISCLRYLQSGSLLLEGERSQGVAPKASTAYIEPPHETRYDRCSEEKKQEDSFNHRDARLLHPFLSYAVENWAFHASHYDVRDKELFTAILEFLQPDSLAFQRWLVLQWGSTSKTRDDTEGIPTAMHIAAFSGLSELILQLIQEGSSVSAMDAQERIPLHWAAANGHAKAASLLIQHGSDPNAEDGRGLKPIHLAARENQASVVTVLLEAGVEPNTIKTKEDHAGYLLGGETVTGGECAIFYACRGGHTDTIIAMIPFCKPETLEQLLCECVRFNRTDAVLAILDRSDVSADATYRKANALYFACGSANARCVDALINRGANVRKTSTWAPRITMHGGFRGAHRMTTPLHRLVTAWNEENDAACRAALGSLIKANVDLEQLDNDGNTALLVAAGASRNGQGSVHIGAIRALLEAGADVKKKTRSSDHGEDTVLHIVLRTDRNPTAVRLLVEYGSDPNQPGRYGETALHCCKGQENSQTRGVENSEMIVKYLLEHGADPNIQDNHGDTAVFTAMWAAPDAFRLLLSRCNDDTVKRRCWFNLSATHKFERFAKNLEVLLAEGIDIETRRSDGRTLFLCCLTEEDQLRTLRGYGAKPSVVDHEGNNSLHILCQDQFPSRDLLEKLIADDGVDPLSTNKDGNTLLHHVASWYKGGRGEDSYVRWLLSLGISVNAVNNEGSTVLHVYQTRIQGSGTTHEHVHFVHALNDGNELDFEIRDKNGFTALHLAAMRSGMEAAILVAAGADLRFLTEDSQNVLHLSCRARQPDIVGQFLDQHPSIDVNHKDRFGRTPLHYACSSGEPESVGSLLKHSANVHAVDSINRTPLHACAEFRAEQNIWDTNGEQTTNPWLRGPTADPLRPGSFTPPITYREPWYKTRQDGDPKSGIRKTFFPRVTTVAKMLLAAGCHAASVDKYELTALDVAISLGCAEITEVFASDEKLFLEATEKMGLPRSDVKDLERCRQYMRTQMLLMRPRSSLPVLSQDKSAYNGVLESPTLYLELLTCEDAVNVINQGFSADGPDCAYYDLLEQLMKGSHIHVAERVSPLVLHYSSHITVKDRAERKRVEGDYYVGQGVNYVNTALQLACNSAKPNLQMLHLLVESHHVDVNVLSATIPSYPYSAQEVGFGGTALHILALANHWWQLEAIRYLIASGASVNARDGQGQTPLHVAAKGKRHSHHKDKGSWSLAAVRVLLGLGADPNSLDNKGLTPLHKASDAPEIMKELLLRGADATAGARNPLFLAIHGQNLSALETLLEHGVSANSLDEGRRSRNINYSLEKPQRKVYALLSAAFAEELNSRVPESVPLFRALVKRGADLYLPLNDDETLIHFLFEYPEYEVQDALLQEPCVSRIDFDRRDQRGRTVLIAACNWHEVLPGYEHLHWKPKATGLPLRILDLDADATLVDDEGKTALHHLLTNNNMLDDVLIQFINRKEVAPILLVKDNAGFSSFHHALRRIRPEVCNLLLSKGANLLEADPNGLTALHYIANQCLTSHRIVRHSHVDLPKDYLDQCLALWQRFVAAGGSINTADHAGNTPLLTFLASMNGQPSRQLEHYDKLFPLDSGVDVFAANKEGETALHVIAKREKEIYYDGRKDHGKELFELMMGKGVDPLTEDAKGRSALDVASAYEREDILGILGRK